ncbi:L,D-transpeptidase ErfK/SrfK [Nitrosomonas sp. PY1]|nr:L,D-transpeptidase ErfK/SrfK [Nitrosomonas sp. PY1]
MPLATHEFTFDATHDDVIGRLQVIQAKEEDTLSDIARRFNLGLEEILHANPNVDPWLPGEGTPVIIPTEFVLPNVPREGVVINLAAMRLFYFPKAKSSKSQKVITHPVGIGRVEWKTPEGLTKITTKEANPSWIPPESIRKEHAANGDPLPAIVKPGPDNPMGTHVLRLGWPSYAIHGTNKPPSIGLRGSHGCLRMYPEDIKQIFKEIPVGTPVRIVNQPRLLGWRDHTLYLQVYPTLEDDKRNHNTLLNASLTRMPTTQKAKLIDRKRIKINMALLREATLNPRGVAIPVSNSNITLQKHIDSATPTLNILPFNANWDGDNNRHLTATEVIHHINEKSKQNSQKLNNPN